MAKSESQRRTMNLLYGIGASIVIVGALFKIMHWTGGNLMLIIGLVTEAIIFFISAFDPPERELDWTLVYPELGGAPVDYEYSDDYRAPVEDYPKDLIASKIDELFASVNINESTLKGLASSFRNIEKASTAISSGYDIASSTEQYSKELSLAAERVKALNDFYKMQVEAKQIETSMNDQLVEISGRIKSQMDELAGNLTSLNTVYGNMLSAMKRG